jgi:hypothetical protein
VVEEVESSDAETVERPWPEIERLYRQLKVNYEGRGDYPRAGDFHIGEKEARRRNPEARWGPWLLLTMYGALSKYGERALPAFGWLGVLVILYAFGYLGLSPQTGEAALSLGQSLKYSFQSTILLAKPGGIEEGWMWWLNAFQRLTSSPLLALFALALRQQVKR